MHVHVYQVKILLWAWQSCDYKHG